MRTQSAADYKSSPGAIKNDLPNPGTRLRRVYDALMEHRGRSVSCAELLDLVGRGPNNVSYLAQDIEQLRNFYGLEILGTGTSRRYPYYLLCGEYLESGVYVSYLDVDEDEESELKARPKGKAP